MRRRRRALEHGSRLLAIGQRSLSLGDLIQVGAEELRLWEVSTDASHSLELSGLTPSMKFDRSSFSLVELSQEYKQNEPISQNSENILTEHHHHLGP